MSAVRLIAVIAATKHIINYCLWSGKRTLADTLSLQYFQPLKNEVVFDTLRE